MRFSEIVSQDGQVDFREFISQWPDLRSVFVPRRFNGVIAGVLQKAKELPVPKWGFSDVSCPGYCI